MSSGGRVVRDRSDSMISSLSAHSAGRRDSVEILEPYTAVPKSSSDYSFVPVATFLAVTTLKFYDRFDTSMHYNSHVSF